eukprot:12733-Heterococcus_DN1.PRE.6
MAVCHSTTQRARFSSDHSSSYVTMFRLPEYTCYRTCTLVHSACIRPVMRQCNCVVRSHS